MKRNTMTSKTLKLTLLSLLLVVCSTALKSQTDELSSEDAKKIWYLFEKNSELDSLLKLRDEKLSAKDGIIFTQKLQLDECKTGLKQNEEIKIALRNEIQIIESHAKKETRKKKLYKFSSIGSSSVIAIGILFLYLSR